MSTLQTTILKHPDSSRNNIQFDNDGRVGVQISTPVHHLHVNSVGTSVGLALTNFSSGSSGSDGCQFQYNFRNLHINNKETGYIDFKTADQSRMRIGSDGKIGIGTSAPTNLLELHGDAPIIMIRDTSNYVAGTGPEIRFQGKDSDELNKNFAAILGVSHNQNDGQILFKTRNSGSLHERVRIDESGNFGIGTTAPIRPLTVASASGSTNILGVFDNRTGSATNCVIAFSDPTSTAGQFSTRLGSVGDSLAFYTNGANERMRVTSSGKLNVGTTTEYGRIHADEAGMNPDGTTTSSRWLNAAFVASGSFGGGLALLDGTKGYSVYVADSGNDFFIRGHVSKTSAGAGGVKLNNRATSWTSASDERDKENLIPITQAVDKIKTLRAVTGNYTWDRDTSCSFLIAQDVQQVLPEAVSVMNKQAATEDQRLGLAYSQVIPLLTSALQEAITKIETLEQRLSDAGIA